MQQGCHAALEVQGHLAQVGAVQCHAAPFQGHQHVDQRHFHARKKVVQLGGREPRPQLPRQQQGHVGVLGAVPGGAFHVHLIEGHLLGALARYVFITDRLVLQVLARQCVHVVGAPRRVEQVAGDHGVAHDPPQRDALPLQHDDVVLDVLAVF